MRARRLLLLLLEIERNPGIAAPELADRLEVSQRTIYRDITVLQDAGYPVSGVSGRGGGFHLDPDHRPCRVLTTEEAAALVLGATPGLAEDLGLGEARRRAQRILLPTGDRVDILDEGSVLIDPIGWFPTPSPTPHLATVVTALRLRVSLDLRHHRWTPPYEVVRRVDPLGLVLKVGVWYLVALTGHGLRALRVDQIVSARITDIPLDPDPGFDLEQTWAGIVEDFEHRLPLLGVEVRLSATARSWLRTEGDPARLDAVDRAVGDTEHDGEVVVELAYASPEHALADILRLGPEAEIVAPADIRDLARKRIAALAARYERL